MATVEIPADLPVVDEPEACVASRSGGGPAALAAAFRSSAVATSDVTSTVRSGGFPGDWEGAAADSAGVAFAGFRADVDTVTAALEVGVRGLEVYDHQVEAAGRRWVRLDEDRATLNGDLADLRARVDGAADAAPDRVAAFRAEAEGLARRREALVADFDVLARDVETSEDRLVRVLSSVDTVPEGQDAADDPARDRVDAALRHLGDIADDPGEVNRWWESLPPGLALLLMIRDPGLVGGTGGIPTKDRDTANRSRLDRQLDHLQGLQDLGVDLTDEQQRQLDHAESTRDALRLGASAPGVDGPIEPLLLLYDPDAFGGDGAGAIAYGDPDTADNTAVLVPGFNSDLSSLDGLGDSALNLLDELAGNGDSNAVISWVGYDAPNLDLDAGSLLGEGPDVLGVIGERQAEAGGHELVDFVDGLRGSDDGAESNLTVIGHSYGSTTAAHAGVDGLDEDGLVLIGSPGAGGGVGDAGDLGAPHLFVGSRDHDPITWLGGDGALGLGPDPAQEGFGGTRFDAGAGQPFDWDQLDRIGANHSGYYDDGSESLRNLAGIVSGDGPAVTVPGRDQPARDYLGDWLAEQVDETVTDPFREHVLDPIGDTAGGILEDTLDSLVTFGTRGAFVGAG